VDIVEGEQQWSLLGEVRHEPVETVQDSEAAIRRNPGVLAGGSQRGPGEPRRAGKQRLDFVLGQARELTLEE